VVEGVSSHSRCIADVTTLIIRRSPPPLCSTQHETNQYEYALGPDRAQPNAS